MADLLARSGTDPSSSGADVVWQTPGSTGVFSRDGETTRLAGTHPALGGGLLAQRLGDVVAVTSLADGVEIGRFGPAGAGPVAVSSRWLVVRTTDAEADRLEAIALADGGRRVVRSVESPGRLGRPALDGDTLVFHEATSSGTTLREVDLASGKDRLLRRREGALLLNPSLRDGRLAYVHATFERQRLRVGEREGDEDGSDERTIYDMPPTARRDAGHEPGHHRHGAGYRGGKAPSLPQRPRRGITRTLWTTAISGNGVLVARLRHKDGGETDAVLLRAET